MKNTIFTGCGVATVTPMKDDGSVNLKKYADFIILERAATYKEQIQKIISCPISSLIVRPNGDVKLDCILPFVVGNIKTDDIQSIWMKAKKIYDESFFLNYINEALNNKYNVVANNTNNDIFY